MARIYIIKGETGEYCDYDWWLVAAFLDKTEAERYLRLCQDSSDKLIECKTRISEAKCPFINNDGQMKTLYDPSKGHDPDRVYTINEIELVEDRWKEITEKKS